MARRRTCFIRLLKLGIDKDKTMLIFLLNVLATDPKKKPVLGMPWFESKVSRHPAIWRDKGVARNQMTS
jgi:hypothetical protein